MADWTLMDELGFLEGLGVDATTTAYGSVGSGGSTNTKGSYVSLGSVTHDCEGFWLWIGNNTAASRNGLLDIAVDISGTKYIIVPDLLICTGTLVALPAPLWVPIRLPAGAALYARCQADVVSIAVRVGLWPGPQGFVHPGGYGRITAYGPDTATSLGVVLDAGGSGNTKGAWVQLTASSTRDHTGLIVATQNGNNNSRTGVRFLLDIGVGGAGSEKVIVPDMPIRTNVSSGVEVPLPPYFGPFGAPIPAGTRIAARVACSSTSSTDRVILAAAYGYD